MQLRLCNRSQYPTNVRLLTIDHFVAIAKSKIEELEKEAAESENDKKPMPSLVGHELCESPATQAANLKSCMVNAIKEKVSAQFQLPTESILLPARDDLAEYEVTTPQNLKEDPKYDFIIRLGTINQYFLHISELLFGGEETRWWFQLLLPCSPKMKKINELDLFLSLEQ